MKYKNVKVIELRDWDNLVQQTYGRPYDFQQQYGCQSRGKFNITIPSEETEDEDMNDSIPEVVNGDEMGVKFDVWLARDPKQPIRNQQFDFELDLFWSRNFYPDIYTVANDLHKKGLIEAGEYVIDIDW
jgi:hypothetical protein